MTHWKSLGGSAVLMTLLSTTAQADVTAEQVWQAWQDMSANMGQTITADAEDMSGDTLTVSGITMSADVPDGAMVGTIEQVLFKELGDGTVEVTMSPETPITVTTEVEGEEPVEVVLHMQLDGMKMIAAGSETDLSYDVGAASVAVVLDSVAQAGTEVEMAFTVAMNGLAGKYTVTSGALETVATNLTADNLTFDVAMTDPETGGDFKMNGEMAAIKSASSATMAPETDFADMAAALKAGFATSGGFTHGKTNYSFDYKDETSSGKAVGSSDSGGITFAMDGDKLAYGMTSNATDITVSSSDMPFPEVNAKMGELAFNMLMPVAVTTEPQDFSLLTKIVDLTVSDEIWGMFDPAAVLPRDPATVILDVAGKANWLTDIFAIDPAAPPSEETPAQIHALALNQLKVTLGGADLSGTGAFTFDNSDMTTVPGMPKPTGSIDLMLVGGNGLLDKLVQMGLLPEEQAMGAKMMMGMFGRTTEGAEDTLTSQIEMKEDGSIFANGQQIQ